MDVRAIEIEASETARIMRMRTVANMIPAMVEDKSDFYGCRQLLISPSVSLP